MTGSLVQCSILFDQPLRITEVDHQERDVLVGLLQELMEGFVRLISEDNIVWK